MVSDLRAKIINSQDERYGKIYNVVENNNKFCTIIDGNKKADYGHSEVAFICVTCGEAEKEGLINGMCTECFCMSVDAGKTEIEIEKKKTRDRKELKKRRLRNDFFNNLG